MSNKASFTLGLLASLATASTVAATLVLISQQRQDYVKNQAISRYRSFNTKFFNNLDSVAVNEENKKDLSEQIEQTETKLSDPSLSALEKWKLLHQLGEVQKQSVFNYVEQLILDNEFSGKNVKVAEELLSAQASRLQESDLVAQFKAKDLTNIKLAFAKFNEIEKEQKLEWLDQYKEFFDKLIADQYALVEQQLMQPNNSLDDNVVELNKLLPTLALRYKAVQNVEQIENDLFANTFRINDFAKNKKAIEYTLQEAKSDAYAALRNKLAEVNAESKTIVNGNVENVAAAFVNELRLLGVDQDHLANLDLLKTFVSKNASIAQARGAFLELLDYAQNNKLIRQREFNRIISLPSIAKYLDLSKHYLENTQSFIDSSTSQEELDQALANLKVVNQMLQAQEQQNEIIIAEFKGFVQAFEHRFTNLNPVFNSVKLEKDFIEISSKPANEFDKDELIANVTNYRNLINKLANLDTRLDFAIEALSTLSQRDKGLITLSELDRFKENINELALSKLAPSKIISEISAKLSGINTLVEAREVFGQIKADLEAKIIAWNSFDPDIKNTYLNRQALQLSTDLVNKISDYIAQSDYTKAQSIEQKYNLREQVRSIQKIQLFNLQTQTDIQLKGLREFMIANIAGLSAQDRDKVEANGIDTELLATLIQELNDETDIITSVKFNPITSQELQEQIDKYNFLVNALERAKVQNVKLINLIKARNYAATSFNPSAQQPAQYSTSQQNYLNALEANIDAYATTNGTINELITNLANQSLTEANEASLNDLANVFNKTAFEPIAARSNYLNATNQDNVKAIQDANESLQALDRERDEINSQADNLDDFSEEFRKIDEIEDAIDSLSSQETIDNAKINALNEQAKDLLAKINEKKKDGSLINRLERVKQNINNVFPPKQPGETLSPAEQNLRARWDELHSRAQNPNLSREEKAELSEKINALDEVIAKVAELDQALNAFNDKEAQYNADPEKRTRVPEAIANAQKNKDKIASLFNEISLSETTPNTAAFQNALKEIKDHEQKLDLAYTKDKIESAGDGILNKKLPVSAGTNDESVTDYNTALDSLIEYAKNKQNSDSLPEALEAKELLAKQAQLADVIKQAIDAKELIKQDPTLDSTISSADTDTLTKVIRDNRPNVSTQPIDTPEKIAEKMENVKKAIAEVKAKNKLRKLVHNDLNNILTVQEQGSKVLERVKNEIAEAKKKYQAILDSDLNTYTPGEIKAYEQELQEKIAELVAEKNQLQGEYSQARTNADRIQGELEKRVNTSKELDPTNVFTNYEKAKQAYHDDIADASNSTVASVVEKQKAMLAAYNKDLAQNALNKYNGYIARDITSSTHEAMASVKTLASNFKDFATQRVEQNLSDRQVNEFVQLTQAMQHFNTAQKDIVDLIAKLQEQNRQNPNDAETKAAIEQLNELLGNTYAPATPYSKTDLDRKRGELIAKLEKIKEEAARRTNNKILANRLNNDFDRFREQPESLEGQNEQRVAADNANNTATGKTITLEDSVDPQLSAKTKEILDELRKQNQNAQSVADINKITEKLEIIDETKPYTNALALQVASAINMLEANVGQSSELVRSYLDNYLAPLIDQARAEYANVEEYTAPTTKEQAKQKLQERLAAKIREIDHAKDLVNQVIAIRASVEEAKAISTSTNYYTVNGVSGDGNNKVAHTWLDSLAANAVYRSGVDKAQAEAKFNEAKAKIQAAKAYLEKQKQVSDTIGQWIEQREADRDRYAATFKDEEKLTKDMWDLLPKVSDNLSQEQITQRTQQLQAKLDLNTQTRQKRLETFATIETIKSTQAYSDSNQYIVLKRLIDERISDLNKQTRQADTVEQMQTIQDKVARLKNLLPKEVELSLKVRSIREYNDSLVPINDDIRSKKEELNAEITKAVGVIRQDTPEQNEVGNREAAIANAKRLLDLHKARLDVFQRWTQIKTEVDNDGVIDPKEKEQLVHKLEEFTHELNAVQFTDSTTPEQFNNISAKYLEGQSENSVPFLHTLTQQFAAKIEYANIVRESDQQVQGENVSNREVDDAYNALREHIKQADDLIKNRTNATIARRQELIRSIDADVANIISKKRASMNDIKTKAQELFAKLSEAANNTRDLIQDDFQTKAIEALGNPTLTAPDDAVKSIGELNTIIANAIVAHEKQVKAIYTAQKQKLQTELVSLNNYVEDIFVDNIWTSESVNAWNNVRALKDQIAAWIPTKVFAEDKIKEFARPERDQNFVSAYLNENLNYLAQVNQRISDLKTKLQTDLRQMLQQENNVGKVAAFIAKFESEIKFEPTAQDNILDSINLNLIKSTFETLKSSYDQIKAYGAQAETLEAKTSSDIQTRINATRKLMSDIEEFFVIFKRDIAAWLQPRNRFNEVIDYLFKDSANTSQRQAIDNLYNSYFAPANDKTNALSKASHTGWNIQTYLAQYVDQAQASPLSALKALYNAFKDGRIDAEFIKLLNKDNPNVKQGVILEKFAKELKAITDTLPAEQKTLDITENDRFLQLFSNFSNTKIDLNSKFNPVYVRAYLVKDDATQTWYSETSKNESNKVISLKVRYEYKPNNLNIFTNYSGFKHEHTQSVTFKTVDKLGLESKSRDIFYLDKTKQGYDAKQVVANADELGWEVSDRASASTKVLDKFKQALGITSDKPSVLIDYSHNKTYNLDANNNKTENANADNFKFKFILPEFYIYQNSTIINSYNARQFVRLSVEGQQIVAEIVVPANMFVGPGNYDWNKNTLHVVRNQPVDDTETMPSAIISTVKFAFDYDAASKDISMFITRYETWHVAKHKKLQDPSITPTKTYQDTTDNNNTAYVWTNDDFAQWLILNNASWSTKNTGDSPLRHIAANANNGNAGKTVEEKYIIKNPRSSETYIKTANVDGDNIKVQTKLNGTIMVNVFNSGIEFFEFKDIKSN
ncbi:hypothetical protein [Mycoplasma simbae]|uniref:hypothetical protein n=1 Tax=Mycoplasma simbae TaxID=36744 RepID=UPI0004968D7B|nr:hypothetical protein [Mycoplasma simbae]